MVSRLITSIGYSWAMRSSAFLILAMLIVANLTVRAHGSNSRRTSIKPDMAKPFKEPGFVLLMAGMFLLTFGIYVPINYLPLQAIQGGMRPDLAQYLVSILNAARYVLCYLLLGPPPDSKIARRMPGYANKLP